MNEDGLRGVPQVERNDGPMFRRVFNVPTSVTPASRGPVSGIEQKVRLDFSSSRYRPGTSRPVCGSVTESFEVCLA